MSKLEDNTYTLCQLIVNMLTLDSHQQKLLDTLFVFFCSMSEAVIDRLRFSWQIL